ncbi:MAG TPA: hypothetical protein VHQ45_06200, partial [Gemmatimonadaceae bacterium]|nr:hypothetical protein [Gemmatimonadaceae bacterium]
MLAHALLIAAACAAAAGFVDRMAARDGGDADVTARLADVWDAEFLLERVPMGTPGTDRHSVRGSLVLLERPGHGRAGALLTPIAHVGVYHVDSRPFGFSPSMDRVVP